MQTVRDMLANAIRAQGMTVAAVARAAGGSPVTLYAILAGRRSLSPAIAISLETVLGLRAEALLHVQLADEIEATRQNRFGQG